MKLSMWNFKEWFQAHGLDCSYQISEKRVSIESVEYGSRNSVKSTDGSVAYVIPGEYLGHLCRSALCCAGDFIQFPTASENEVMNQSLELIADCNEWTDHLMNCIVKEQSLEEFLNHADTRFSFALKLIFRDSSISYQTDNWVLPVSWNDISSVPEDERSHLPFFCTLKIHGCPRTVLQRSLSYKGRTVAVLIASDENDIFRPGDFAFFEQIANILEIDLTYRIQENSVKNPLDAWFASQLTGNDTPDKKHPGTIAFTGWNDDRYNIIAAVRADGSMGPDPSLFSRAFHGQSCCAMIHRTLFVLIRPGSDLADGNRKIRKRLETIASSHALRIGTSLLFRGFSNLREYAAQAENSVPAADSRNESVIFTEDQLKSRILDACGKLSEAKNYIPPALSDLASASSGTPDDITVLYTYLILGCSIAHTSERLYLHRNTLSTRLARIRRALNSSLDDPEENRDLLTGLITLFDRCAQSAADDQ
jgi:hypothetical protein